MTATTLSMLLVSFRIFMPQQQLIRSVSRVVEVWLAQGISIINKHKGCLNYVRPCINVNYVGLKSMHFEPDA